MTLLPRMVLVPLMNLVQSCYKRDKAKNFVRPLHLATANHLRTTAVNDTDPACPLFLSYQSLHSFVEHVIPIEILFVELYLVTFEVYTALSHQLEHFTILFENLTRTCEWG